MLFSQPGQVWFTVWRPGEQISFNFPIWHYLWLGCSIIISRTLQPGQQLSQAQPETNWASGSFAQYSPGKPGPAIVNGKQSDIEIEIWKFGYPNLIISLELQYFQFHTSHQYYAGGLEDGGHILSRFYNSWSST